MGREYIQCLTPPRTNDREWADEVRHLAGHPGEIAPELECGFCRDEIREEIREGKDE